MITFPTAPTVALGDKVTSTEYNLRVAAFNARLRAGFDGTWRLWWKVWNLVKQVRNPQDENTYPSSYEWLTHFMHIPGNEAEWGGAPGDPAGENVVNPLMGFIYGTEQLDVVSEDGRLNVVPGGNPSGAREFWELGKLQRGAYDPATGAEAAPALQAARAHRHLYDFAYLSQSWQAGLNGDVYTTSFLKKYGGTLARPPFTRACTNAVGAVISYDFKIWFTPLNPAVPFKSYNSQCPPGTTQYAATNVLSLQYLTDRYRITLYNGTVEELLYADYLEGPYFSNGTLMHTPGDQIDEALHAFVQEFRGTPEQRAGDTFRVRSLAFDFQRFLTSQYFLAPAQGVETGEEVLADYPLFGGEDYVPTAIGFELPCSNHGNAGFAVLGAGTAVVGVLISHGDIEGSHDIILWDDDEMREMARWTVSGGAGDRVIWYEQALPETLRVRVLSVDEPTGYGLASVQVELAVLERRSPELVDAYLVTRRASTRGAAPDASGQDTPGRALSDSYFAHACLVNGAELPAATHPGDNPVHESLRRMLRDNLRVAPRQQVTGYAIENGKSVLWFNRHVNISAQFFDMFDGLGPPLSAIPSGQLLGGVTYRAVGGAIRYNEVDTADGETFLAVNGLKTYSGQGLAWQVNGIIPTAPSSGLSNEWLCFVTTRVYHPSEESAWKPENYGDVQTFLHQRCHFYGAMQGDAPDLGLHAAPSQNIPISVEAPGSLNYYRQLNSNVSATDADRRKFFKSCPVYQPDYEIESAVMDGAELKVTFTTRLAYSAAAPAGDIPRDIALWDLTALHGERVPLGWRTDENAIREYLVYAAGLGDCRSMPGDASALADVESPFSAGSKGCCFPHFHFTKLIEKVAEDEPSNTTAERTDTRVLARQVSWQVYVLDAMCEAYVDRQSSDVVSCPDMRPMQYTLPNLLFQAAGGSIAVVTYDAITGIYDDTGGGVFILQGRDSRDDRWLDLDILTESPTLPPITPAYIYYRLVHFLGVNRRWVDLLPAAVRPDRPQGFGPLATFKVYADTVNLLSAALNLLTRVPLELPWEVESRQADSYAHNFQMDALLFSQPGPPLPPYRQACPDGETRFSAQVALWGDYNDIRTQDIFAGYTEWRPGFFFFSATASADGNDSPIVEAGGLAHHSGFEVGTFLTGPKLYLRCFESKNIYNVLASQAVGELRLKENQACLEAVPAALRENLSESFSLTGYLRRQETWWEQGGPALDCAGIVEGNATPHARESVTCVTWDAEDGIISLLPALYKESPSDVKLPLHPSFYHMAYTVFNACMNGPRTQIFFGVNGPPQISINIPLDP